MISVVCPNGHKLNAKEKLAGKKVKCPKCQVTIQIPSLPKPETFAAELVEDTPSDTAPSAAVSNTGFEDGGLPNLADLNLGGIDQGADPFAADSVASELPDPLAAELPDPLNTSYSDPLAATGNALQQAATGAGASSAYAPKVKAVKEEKKEGFDRKLLLIVAGVGGGVGLLLLGLIGWLVFGGSGNTPPIAKVTPPPAATNNPPSADPGNSPGPNDSSRNAADSGESSLPAAAGGGANSIANEQKDLGPFDLRRLELDPSIRGYELPGETWGFAYDEESGHLAVSNDEKGILVYDIEKVLAGNTTPIIELATAGRPMGLCFKELGTKRVFVTSGEDAPELTIYGADSLRALGRIPLKGIEFARHLAVSQNPRDPYLYFVSHKRDVQRSSDDPFNTNADKLGRVNLLNGEQGGFTQQNVLDAVLSNDGRTILARDSSENALDGEWDTITKERDRYARGRDVIFERRIINDLVAYSSTVYFNEHPISSHDYEPLAAYGAMNLVLGTSERGLVLASANDFRRYVSVDLPEHWFRERRERVQSPDIRWRMGTNARFKSNYLNAATDSKRKIGIVCLADKIVFATHASLKLPDEPLLVPKQPTSLTVAPGKSLNVPLKLARSQSSDVQFEYVPHTVWLDNEEMPLLGLLPPGTPNKKVLNLASPISKEASQVKLQDYKALNGKKPPFFLRVGREIMRVTAFEKYGMKVERKRPMSHQRDSRVAVLDAEGRDITTPKVKSARRVGKEFVLTGEVGARQTEIIPRRFEDFEGLPLPFEIQIQEERMKVVEVDDFREMLRVEREIEKIHPVSSMCYIVDESQADVGPNLPKVQGDTLVWKPRADQIGKHIIRMRARSGRYEHEFFWELNVEREKIDLPFQVVGIEPESGTREAVIWGQSRLPELEPPNQRSGEPIQYFLAIYNLDSKKVTKRLESKQQITAALLHRTGIYTAVTDGKTRKIVLYDRNSLKILRQQATRTYPTRLVALADKVLLPINEKLRSSSALNEKFRMPTLQAMGPQVDDFGFMVSGKIDYKCLLDGVLYDESLSKPLLLVAPTEFEERPSNVEETVAGVGGGEVQIAHDGPYVCTWYPQFYPIEELRYLSSVPGGVRCIDGNLEYYSWSNSSQKVAGDGTERKPKRVIELVTSDALQEYRKFNRDEFIGYVTEVDREIHVAFLGQLYSVPLADLETVEEEPFRFVEEQSQFVYDPKKPMQFSYSAPGANRYELFMWYMRPRGYLDLPPKLVLNSVDGKFRIVPGQLKGIEGQEGRTAADEDAARMYEKLTGKKLRGMVFPLYVGVVATHEDGVRKAGLTHVFLVEVPAPPLKRR